MRFVDTAENLAYSICKLVSREQPIGLDHLSLAVHLLRFYGVKARALLGQQADDDAYSTAAVFDFLVVSCNPTTHELALVPGGIVPDKKQSLLAKSFEPLAAPTEKLRGYGAHWTTVHEPKPGLLKLRHIEPVARESLRIGIVLYGLLLENSHRLSRLDPRMQRRSLKAAPPGLVLVAQNPLGVGLGKAYQPLESPLSEKAPRVKCECGLYAHLRCAPGGSRPFA